MFNRFTLAFIGAMGMALAGCAPTPAPTPIMPEPTYDKFGNLQYDPGDSCVPIRPETFDPTQGYYTNDRLVPCCPEGTQFNPRTQECVPIPERPRRDDDDHQDRNPDPQRDPTTGRT
ncbi:hypothetical protein [Celeribacter sp. PS-C1]|uniref:hypothetical protein n=1 Tax=Celeribacter sp. PS-C1 TaxID=2820813 RepID=UPI001CA5417A|nr:hypothetical protein [Celeribacter sp. PS-C1]MBW6416678.1 hypothetical protein [Celeribacter sp. PS-C1]